MERTLPLLWSKGTSTPFAVMAALTNYFRASGLHGRPLAKDAWFGWVHDFIVAQTEGAWQRQLQAALRFDYLCCGRAFHVPTWATRHIQAAANKRALFKHVDEHPVLKQVPQVLRADLGTWERLTDLDWFDCDPRTGDAASRGWFLFGYGPGSKRHHPTQVWALGETM